MLSLDLLLFTVIRRIDALPYQISTPCTFSTRFLQCEALSCPPLFGLRSSFLIRGRCVFANGKEALFTFDLKTIAPSLNPVWLYLEVKPTAIG